MQQSYFEQPEENINIQEILQKYTQHWKWILGFTFLFCGAAFLYLKVQPSTYVSTSTVLVKDDKKGSLGDGLDIFSDLGLSKGNSNLHNEIEVFKSRDLVGKVIKELHLNAQLVQENNALSANTYFYKDNAPLEFVFSDSTDQRYKQSFKLELSKVDNEDFKVRQITSENGKETTLAIGKVKYGEEFNTKGGPVKVIQTAHFEEQHKGQKFAFNFQSLSAATNRWKANFEVNTVNKDASVLVLSAKGLMRQANNDFINQMIIEHEENAIADKNEITKNTSNFISERMMVIEEELSVVEGINEKFKTDNHLVDVERNAEMYLDQEGTIEKMIVETSIQLSLAEYMVEYLSKYEDYSTLLPANLGFSDQSINAMTQEYNKLILERNKLIQGASEANPLAKKLENQLSSLRNSITKSLNNAKDSMELRVKKLKSESSKYKKLISDIPEFERRFREIQRQQQIKETLYLYLLQKREENQIAMASTLGNVKIIDSAYANDTPVAPKKQIIFLAAFILGIAIPIGFIYIRDLLDNKVRTPEELEDTGIAVVGNIPQSKIKETLISNKTDRTLISEAYRMLRTNMRFLLEKKEEGQVIFLSSSMPGEGKTFTSINLANSLGLTEKKVILIGLDLRAPKLAEYLDKTESLPGASNYLSNPDTQINDLIHRAKNEVNFDYIFSGDIPPNPSELLTRPRMKEFFTELKQQYDYIIVDTSPMALVVDTVSIIEHADLLLYVVRANHAHKNSLEIPQRLQKEKKVNKLAFVLNGSTRKHGAGYGYGNYGYGTYGENVKKKWWKR
ncbi:MAG TPA: polysaccharide biosynthesis tyrosine autokinase [Brumimicrobium sp.]|nr:polysaccharide biosynthesis tyrosine autokinase [Brumimicrobium sp.]